MSLDRVALYQKRTFKAKTICRASCGSPSGVPKEAVTPGLLPDVVLKDRCAASFVL